MPAVLLAGAFGQHNPGDEALLTAFRLALPGWTHVATTQDPADTAFRHGCIPTDSTDARGILRTLRSVDAVVFAGGTIFKTLPESTGRGKHSLLINALALATVAKLRGRSVAMVGVGVGKLDTPLSRLLASRLARMADLLVVRDEESAHSLAAAGGPSPIRIGADVAWTLLDLPPEPQRHNNDVLVALSSFAGGRSTMDRILPALVEQARAGRKILLQPWQVEGPPPGDRQVGEAIVAALADHDVEAELLAPPADLADASALMRGCAVVMGMRFHSLVAAAAAGVPFLALAHENKLAGLARRLGQPAVSPTDDAAVVASGLRDALEVSPPSAAAVRGEIASAGAGLDLMRLLLTGGGGMNEITDLTGLPLEPAQWQR